MARGRFIFLLAVALASCLPGLAAAQSSGGRLNDWPKNPTRGAIEVEDGRKVTLDDRSSGGMVVEYELPAGWMAAAEKMMEAGDHDRMFVSAMSHLRNKKVLDWLEVKARAGYPSAMWILADGMSMTKPDKSVAWGYAALAATYAEQTNCLESDAKNFGAAHFIQLHPSVQRAAKLNPHVSEESHKFAFGLLESLRSWPVSPAWLCKNQRVTSSANPGMEPSERWASNRKARLSELRRDMVGQYERVETAVVPLK